MRFFLAVICLAFGLASPGENSTSAAWAADRAVLVSPKVEAHRVWSPNGVTMNVVEAHGQAFTHAVSIRTASKPANFWEAQVIRPLARVVPAGAEVRVQLTARATDGTKPAIVDVAIKTLDNDYIGGQQVKIGAEWTPVDVRVAVPRAVRAKLELNVGHQAQTVEVGGVQASYRGGDPSSVDTLRKADAAAAGATSPPPPRPAVGSYYAKLFEEFAAAGEARSIMGDTDEQTLAMFSNAIDGKGHGVRPAEAIDVQGLPFKRALRVTVDNERSTGMWDISLPARNARPVQKGDVLLWTFWARGSKAPQKVDDGAGPVIGALMWRPDPYGHVSWPWPSQEITGEWKRYWAVSEINAGTGGPGGIEQDYAAGQLGLNLMLGYKNQTVEIGGIAVMAFADADVTALPQQEWTYVGREPDAPWRAEAERRIEQHRKAPLTVEVRDAAGKPVDGAKVAVRQTEHAFNFGISFTAKLMLDEKMPQYRENALKYFNYGTFANDLKWGHMEDGWNGVNEADTLAVAKLWHTAGKRLRGHVLVWPGFQNAPERIRKLKDDPAAMQREILKHVTETLTKYKDYIHDWDVTNETEGNRDFMDIIGPQAMVEWYKAAKAADPDLKLAFTEPTFGDHGMEGGSFPSDRLPGHRGWVDYLIKQGAPLDYLAAQQHGGGVGTESSGGAYGLWKQFDELHARYGKKLLYTELDIALKDEQSPNQLAWQGDKIRDTLTIAFAHPAFDGILFWGFWDGDVWLAGSGLWDRNWKPKPALRAYEELVFHKWRTNTEGTTDAQGRYQVRAFHGDYEVTATAEGRSATATATVRPDGESVVITLR